MQRFSTVISKSILDGLFQGRLTRTNLIQNYNVAPKDPVSMIIAHDGFSVTGKWGQFAMGEQITPFVDYRQVHSRPSFRLPFRNQRCLILADSFYIWNSKDKLPYRVLPEDGLFYLPAIYFLSDSNEFGFTILSRTSRQSIRNLSSIEPVIFNSQEALNWLEFLPVSEVIRNLQVVYPRPWNTHAVTQKVLIQGFNSKIVHQIAPEQVLLF